MKRGIKVVHISLIVIFLLVGGYFIGQKIQVECVHKQMTKIAHHYHKEMKAVRTIPLYQKAQNGSFSSCGEIYEDSILQLESIDGFYYKLASCNYYVFYQDVVPTFDSMKGPSSNYLLWKEDIITKDSVILYQENLPRYKLDFSIRVPIVKKERDFYTVSFYDKQYQIKQADIEREIESERFEEDLLEKISIFYFQEEGAAEEKIKYLKQEGYIFIRESVLQEFLAGTIHLPKKSVMLVFKNESDYINKLIQLYDLTVMYSSDLSLSYKEGDHQVFSTSDITWYSIDSNTTMNRFQEMLIGKPEVKSIQENPAQKIAVLNYHFFYDKTGGNCNESICLDYHDFEEQLRYLKENGFYTPTMQEFSDWLDQKIELPSKSVVLTVDDGAMGTENILPTLLEKYQLHATLFLISSWWPKERYQSKYLEIQSHGHDLHHNSFCREDHCGVKGLILSREEIDADLQKSKETIGNPIAFCYPFYAFNDSLVAAVKDAFSLAFVGGNKKASRRSNRYKIPRYIIYKNTSLDAFKKMIYP